MAGRKKGAPKWKRVLAEIELLQKRMQVETPSSGVLYYKYGEKKLDENGDAVP